MNSLSNQKDLSVGIDFGTTNTVIALAERDGPVRSLRFNHNDSLYEVYRTLLCYEETIQSGQKRVDVTGGPWALEQYINARGEIRFLQSFKSHVASKLFQETQIFARRYTLQDIMSDFFQQFIENAEGQLDLSVAQVVAGRPIVFAGHAPDEELATSRYNTAYASIGLENVNYVYEPVGAAYYYAQSIEKEATILVADFGGGTSDFSIVRFERNAQELRSIPLGYAGLGIAGDTFDSRLIDHIVSPSLGKGSGYYSLDKKILEMPTYYYNRFCKWHELGVLKSPTTLKELRSLRSAAVEPELLDTFIDVVDNDWSMDIYKAISKTKMDLTLQEETDFSVRFSDSRIEKRVARSDFENWIAKDLKAIEEKVEELLASSGLSVSAIDKVFLTGGTSYVPAVQKLFARHFGQEKLASGKQLESVAYGLALVGLDQNLSNWTV
ncbi:Hsp70 family protein [Kiloniella laminariae]|uniref:Hsp70 family protein n=1 Tax=Kiloniella laminariae TaxID=454162 RepID=A0ABT4LID0_9PROT|nr:Hsp70 family protein [Kiloniella laminariae]MCZ4280856.1 Hsp70 family protein [Kiloniella laminariae]